MTDPHFSTLQLSWSGVAKKRFPDATFDNYHEARHEALGRSFKNTAISSDVIDENGQVLFVALDGADVT